MLNSSLTFHLGTACLYSLLIKQKLKTWNTTLWYGNREVCLPNIKLYPKNERVIALVSFRSAHSYFHDFSYLIKIILCPFLIMILKNSLILSWFLSLPLCCCVYFVLFILFLILGLRPWPIYSKLYILSPYILQP